MQRFLQLMVRMTTKAPKRMLILTMILTALFGWSAAGIQLQFKWDDLAPRNHPSVEEYRQITEDFPSLNMLYVTVRAGGEQELDAAVKRAVERLDQLQPYVSSVTAGTDIDFLVKNGMLLSEQENIRRTGIYLSNPNFGIYLKNLNQELQQEINWLEQGKIQPSEIGGHTNEDWFSSFMGIHAFFRSFEDVALHQPEADLQQGITRLFFGDPYTRSSDGTKVLLMVQPNFDIDEYKKLAEGIEAIQSSLAEIERTYEGIDYQLSGTHLLVKESWDQVRSASYVIAAVGLLVILLILFFSFRMFRAPMLTFLPLLIGIIWGMGIVSLCIGKLNVLSVFSLVLLIGLGIDYAIHFLSAYTEWKQSGKSAPNAIKHAFFKTGPGMIIGALTTAAAFFTMLISSIGVLREFGAVMGIGIICILTSTLIVLPSVLILKKEAAAGPKTETVRFTSMGKTAAWISRHRTSIAVLLLGSVFFFGWKASHNQFDFNLNYFQPADLSSSETLDHLLRDFGIRPAGLFLREDRLEDVYLLDKELEAGERIAEVYSITDVLPPREIQKERLETIQLVKNSLLFQTEYKDIPNQDLLEQLKLLEYQLNRLLSLYEQKNRGQRLDYAERVLLDEKTGTLPRLIERIQTGEIPPEEISRVSRMFYDHLQLMGSRMLVSRALTIKDLPERYRDQWVGPNGDYYLIKVFPDFKLWEHMDDELGMSFVDRLNEIHDGITGTPVFVKLLHDSFATEAVKTGAAALSILLVILYAYFRTAKMVLVSILSMLLAFVFTAGVTGLAGIKWNIYNVLVFPLILGVGLDAAVHILQRYLVLKESVSEAFSGAGRAIMISVLTTMVAFASFAWIDILAVSELFLVMFIGIGFTFLMTMIVLPLFLKDKGQGQK